MIKKSLVLVSLLYALSAHAIDFTNTTLAANDVEKISAAIYKIEGGANTKFPYGVRSINTGGNMDKAKKICQNTIKNNFARWNKTNKQTDFLTYLANVYCPKSADANGNKNWIKNIHQIIK